MPKTLLVTRATISSASLVLHVQRNPRLLTLRVFQEYEAFARTKAILGLSNREPPIREDFGRYLATHLSHSQENRWSDPIGARVPGALLAPHLAEQVYGYVGASILDLDLLGPGEWTEHASMCIYLDLRAGARPSDPFNYYATSTSTKAGWDAGGPARRGWCGAVAALVTDPTEDLTASAIVVSAHSPDHVIANFAFDETTTEPRGAWDRFWTTLELSGPDTVAPDATVEFEVAAHKPDGSIDPLGSTIYLESSGGYLPAIRVALNQGRGSFRATALGLRPGESFKIKAGWRCFTGVADKRLTVI